MKKILLMMCLTIALLLSSMNVKAQTLPYSISVSGGYSWLTGVIGGEAQIGNFGLAGGWMPAKMPMSGDRINSACIAASYYTLPVGQEGYSMYITLAEATSGYRYEDSWGGESVVPMTIIAVGSKYETGGVWSKLGVGYGWCDDGNAWTVEFTLGFKLFGN